MEQKLQTIREKCIAANPEIRTRRPEIAVNPQRDVTVTTTTISEPKIGLCDVLYALDYWACHDEFGNEIQDTTELTDYLHDLVREETHIMITWKKLKDSLTDQSPETIDFIHSLLTK